jgi:aspartate carbamoyltransferase catalytic subunit
MSLSHTIETAGLPPASSAAGVSPRRHVLDLDDFSPVEISSVLDTSCAMAEILGRDIKKVPALRGRVIVTLFNEPSTRTRISFEEAGKVLSADVINMSTSGTSIEKGESLLNTGLTLQAMGVNVIVIRHPHSGAPYLLARCLDRVSIINAGDGIHAHPTQALLDLHTIREKLGRLEGVKIVIVGDILHSRVARSDLWGFTKMGAQVTLCGPTTLLPLDLLQRTQASQSPQPSTSRLKTPGYRRLPEARSPKLEATGGQEGFPFASVKVDTDLDRAIEGVDVVLALRLQTERQEAGFLPSLREYVRRWQVTEDRLARAKPKVLVMHPGPMNEGIEISASIAHGGSSVIEQQVTNGVAVRMALLYQLSTVGP